MLSTRLWERDAVNHRVRLLSPYREDTKDKYHDLLLDLSQDMVKELERQKACDRVAERGWRCCRGDRDCPAFPERLEGAGGSPPRATVYLAEVVDELDGIRVMSAAISTRPVTESCPGASTPMTPRGSRVRRGPTWRRPRCSLS